MSAECRFEGKVAVITGAGRGLGRSHAILLAQRGARVIINDLGGSPDGMGPGAAVPADDTVDSIRQSGGQAVADYNDISTPEGAKALVAGAIESFGRVDILINNAGVYKPQHFLAISPEQFARTLMVHVGGHFYCTQAVWPHMAARGSGRIVMTTSGVGIYGLEQSYDYAAAKGGIFGLTRALSIDAAQAGITINAVAPIAFTRMNDSLEDPVLRRYFEANLRTELVSPLVAWLAHEDCSSQGGVFGIGGGRVARIVASETEGIHDDGLTIETIRDRFAEICDQENVRTPANATEASFYMVKGDPYAL